jgi:hypothetical protein
MFWHDVLRGGLLRDSTLIMNACESAHCAASDGAILCLADFTSGVCTNILLLVRPSASLTHIWGAGITDVSYDSSNNSLWITDASTNQVLDFSTSGTLLSQFSTGAFRPGSGIAVVPVPEPSCGGFSQLPWR